MTSTFDRFRATAPPRRWWPWFLCGMLAASWLSPPAASGQTSAPTSAARTEALLKRPVEVELSAAPLSGLQSFLRRQGIQSVIDHGALQDAAIDPTQLRFTLKTPKMPLEEALELLFSKGLPNHPGDRLSYLNQSGMLVITTAVVEEETLSTRLYPVESICPLQWFRDPVTNQWVRERDLESLQQVIMSSVAPDSWDEVGGPGAIEAIYAGKTPTLVISQTRSTHRRIAGLLARLAQLAQRTADHTEREVPTSLGARPPRAIGSRGGPFALPVAGRRLPGAR